MGGIDTSRGINFQYACALSIIIDVPSNSEWAQVQLEGDSDIEDLLILDADNQALLRAQIKHKTDPDQWRPSEIRDVIEKFSLCPDSERVQYKFIYSGSEGKSIVETKPVFLKIQYEGWKSLPEEEKAQMTELFGQGVSEFLARAGSRLSLDRRESRESIRARDLLRIRRLVTSETLVQVEEGEEEVIYNRLFQQVAGRSEDRSRYLRRLSRAEILQALNISSDYSSAQHFDEQEYASWLSKSAEETKYPTLFPIAKSPKSFSPEGIFSSLRDESEISGESHVSLPSALSKSSHLCIVGDAGSGKTTLIWQLVHSQCHSLLADQRDGSEEEKVPVYVDLAGYDGEPINKLIRYSIEASGQSITPQLQEQLARKGHVAVYFDNFDTARRELLGDLLLRLKRWIRAHPRCTVLVVSHRPADGHNLNLSTFRLLPFSTEKSHEFLISFPEMSPRDATTILNSLPSESMHLTYTPLTLLMLALAYLDADRKIPKSLGHLHKEVTSALMSASEARGNIQFERSDKLQILGILAAWTLDNEIYKFTPNKIGNLLSEWLDEGSPYRLKHLQATDKIKLRDELLQSGLFRYAPDGTVEFIHSTFQAYLAALTITKEQASALLNQHQWETSILLWTSVVSLQESECLVELLMDSPDLLGRVIQERNEKRGKVTHQIDFASYFREYYSFQIGLLKQFTILGGREASKDEKLDSLDLAVAEIVDVGYAINWTQSKREKGNVRFSPINDLFQLADDRADALPYPIFLLPNVVPQMYHPIELAYLIILRSLFDLLVFMGWEGGIDPSQFATQEKAHPSIAMITNRFIAYQGAASALPKEFAEKLPFFATRAFHLVIELDKNRDLPIVRFAIIPSEKESEITVTQSILDTDTTIDKSLFEKTERFGWILNLASKTVELSSIEEETLPQVMNTPPGSYAQKLLYDNLCQYLPGFPPDAW